MDRKRGGEEKTGLMFTSKNQFTIDHLSENWQVSELISKENQDIGIEPTFKCICLIEQQWNAVWKIRVLEIKYEDEISKSWKVLKK